MHHVQTTVSNTRYKSCQGIRTQSRDMATKRSSGRQAMFLKKIIDHRREDFLIINSLWIQPLILTNDLESLVAHKKPSPKSSGRRITAETVRLRAGCSSHHLLGPSFQSKNLKKSSILWFLYHMTNPVLLEQPRFFQRDLLFRFRSTLWKILFTLVAVKKEDGLFPAIPFLKRS